jgi:hypothetical protein
MDLCIRIYKTIVDKAVKQHEEFMLAWHKEQNAKKENQKAEQEEKLKNCFWK